MNKINKRTLTPITYQISSQMREPGEANRKISKDKNDHSKIKTQSLFHQKKGTKNLEPVSPNNSMAVDGKKMRYFTTDHEYEILQQANMKRQSEMKELVTKLNQQPNGRSNTEARGQLRLISSLPEQRMANLYNEISRLKREIKYLEAEGVRTGQISTSPLKSLEFSFSPTTGKHGVSNRRIIKNENDQKKRKTFTSFHQEKTPKNLELVSSKNGMVVDSKEMKVPKSNNEYQNPPQSNMQHNSLDRRANNETREQPWLTSSSLPVQLIANSHEAEISRLTSEIKYLEAELIGIQSYQRKPAEQFSRVEKLEKSFQELDSNESKIRELKNTQKKRKAQIEKQNINFKLSSTLINQYNVLDARTELNNYAFLKSDGHYLENFKDSIKEVRNDNAKLKITANNRFDVEERVKISIVNTHNKYMLNIDIEKDNDNDQQIDFMGEMEFLITAQSTTTQDYKNRLNLLAAKVQQEHLRKINSLPKIEESISNIKGLNLACSDCESQLANLQKENIKLRNVIDILYSDSTVSSEDALKEALDKRLREYENSSGVEKFIIDQSLNNPRRYKKIKQDFVHGNSQVLIGNKSNNTLREYISSAVINASEFRRMAERSVPLANSLRRKAFQSGASPVRSKELVIAENNSFESSPYNHLSHSTGFRGGKKLRAESRESRNTFRSIDQDLSAGHDDSPLGKSGKTIVHFQSLDLENSPIQNPNAYKSVESQPEQLVSHGISLNPREQDNASANINRHRDTSVNISNLRIRNVPVLPRANDQPIPAGSIDGSIAAWDSDDNKEGS